MLTQPDDGCQIKLLIRRRADTSALPVLFFYVDLHAVSNIDYPGIQAIISRVQAIGTVSPEVLVDTCLDLLGPVEVAEDTRDELLALANKNGELRWDTEEERDTSSQRVGDMLALVTSTKEYQFA